jgi:hypothetical protein
MEGRIDLKILLLLLLTAGVAIAAPPPRADLRRLREAALASDYAWRQCEQLCDGIGPRLSGSPGAAAAVAYVADELRRQGLQVHLEPITVPHWVRGVETGEVVSWPGQPEGLQQKLVLTALGDSVATAPEGLTAEVVVVDSFDALAALPDERVRGRIVLFNHRFDRQMAAMGRSMDAYEQAVGYRWAGPVAAARKGAVLSLVRSVGDADFRLPHTGAFKYDDKVAKIPAAALSAEDADLLATLAARGAVRVHVTLTPRTLPPAQSFNVVADLKGTTRADEIVIVSGHLDSWDLGTGAIDDAAGVAIAMAVPRLVRQLDLHPTRTIRVIAYMNEENGLAGGRGYAEAHKGELRQHFAAFESDFGAGHPVGFTAHVGPHASKLLEPLSDVLDGLAQITSDPGGADVWPLDEAGVPTFSPLVDGRTYFDYHHTAADTLDKIDPRALRENAAVAAVVAYGLATLDGDLRN